MFPASGLIQASFSVTMTSVEQSRKDHFFSLVLSALEDIAVAGFPGSEIEAAINTVVISLRTLPAESSTWGVGMLQGLAGPWVYGRDIFQEFSFTSPLNDLRDRLAAGEDVFGDLIREYLLQNNHRVDCTLLPSPQLSAKLQGFKTELIKEKIDSLTPESAQKLAAETIAFNEFQADSDSPAAIASIPMLAVSDLDQIIDEIPTEVMSYRSGTLLEFEQPTAGILYVNVALHTDAIDEEELALLPLLSIALANTGTSDMSAADLNVLMGQVTGGISVDADVRRNSSEHASGPGKPSPIPLLSLSGKCERHKAVNLTQIMSSLLVSPGINRSDSQAIMTQLIDAFETQYTNAWTADAYAPAVSMSRAMIDPYAWANDQIGGLPWLWQLQHWQGRLKTPTGWPDLRDALNQLLSRVLSSARPV
eukprot:scaffold153024_cov38-Prasinocladus_malaysianus.AAC.1